MQQVVTVDEAAKYLRCSAHTIRDWIKCGRLPARKVGKAYLITRDALQALVTPQVVSGDAVLSDPERIRRIKEFAAAMRASGITQEKLDELETNPNG